MLLLKSVNIPGSASVWPEAPALSGLLLSLLLRRAVNLGSSLHQKPDLLCQLGTFPALSIVCSLNCRGSPGSTTGHKPKSVMGSLAAVLPEFLWPAGMVAHAFKPALGRQKSTVL